MFGLKKISVRQLYRLEISKFEKYMNLKNVLNSKPNFGRHAPTPLMKLSYGNVKQILRNFSEPSYESILESFTFVYGVSEHEYLIQDVVSYFYALNWVEQEAVKIIENERKALKRTEDPILTMAGVERMAIFGELPTLIDLGQRFGKKPEEIEEWTYGTVFSIQAHDKVQHEVSKEYNKLNTEFNNGPKR